MVAQVAVGLPHVYTLPAEGQSGVGGRLLAFPDSANKKSGEGSDWPQLGSHAHPGTNHCAW